MDGPQTPDVENVPDGTFGNHLERQRAAEEARGRARRAKILAAVIVPLAAVSMAFTYLTREPSQRRSENARRRLEVALSRYTHQDVVLMISPFQPGRLDEIVNGTGASFVSAQNRDGYLVVVADAATWWTRGPHCIVARISPDGTRRVDVEDPRVCNGSGLDPRHPAHPAR